jgi:hypothetical protein
MIRRIVALVVVALVMAAMMLIVVAPAMAAAPCTPAGGLRPQVLIVTPGPDEHLVLFDCVPLGHQPGQPPA